MPQAGSGPPLLTTLPERVALLHDAGMTSVVVLSFTSALSRLSPEEFARDILFGAASASAVVVGANFRFGKMASGDVDLLTALGRSHGVDVRPVDLLDTNGASVSSTRIRAEIATGKMRTAATLLGRPHRVVGRISDDYGADRATTRLAVPQQLRGRHIAVTFACRIDQRARSASLEEPRSRT
jgi:riboflavin kinase / FMN adenylyltransferase